MLQEGVTNIVKHSDAKNVGVILKATPEGVVLIIEDDGKGFEPETVSRGSSPRPRPARHTGAGRPCWRQSRD